MPIHHQLSFYPDDRTAFVVGPHARTYGEIRTHAQGWAAAIEAVPRNPSREVLPDAPRVRALCLPNHIAFAEIFLGATMGQSVCAVLDPAWPELQMRDVLARLQPDVMIALQPVHPAEALGIPLFYVDAPPRPIDRPWPSKPTDGPFLINFTSGTTSAPKAFSRSRASWRASFEVGRGVFGLEQRPTTLCPGALCHGLALYALIETLEAGGTFHSVPQWNMWNILIFQVKKEESWLLIW